MNKRLQFSAVFASLIMLTQPLFAWNNFGHMVVASVAYRNLEKVAPNVKTIFRPQ